MRLARSFRRRFGISVSPLKVRRHLPWYWRLPLVLALLAVGVGLSRWTYDAGMSIAGFRRGETSQNMEQLRERVVRLKEENAAMHSQISQHDQQMQIDRATQNDLAKTVKTLQDENAELKEDVAFFRKLMSGGRGGPGLSVARTKIEKGVLPGEYRYRFMLLQGGQREQEFQGKVQLLVNLSQNGKAVVQTFPTGKGDAGAYEVRFKFYQRLDGTFRVDPAAQVKAIQIRVFEAGSAQPKLMQSINL